MNPIVEPLPPDLTPQEVFNRLHHWPHLLFLDSARADPNLGRYSFLTADPFEFIRCRQGVMTQFGPRVSDFRLQTSGAGSRKPEARSRDPLALVAERLARYQQATLPDLPPFQGGAAGLLAYDLCHYLERLPRPRHDEFQVPDLAVGFYDWVIAFDHSKHEAWMISTGFPEVEPQQRRRRAEKRLRQVRAALGVRNSAFGVRSSELGRWSANTEYRIPNPEIALSVSHPLPGVEGLLSNFSRDAYLTAIRRAIEYIYAGDVFQVNLSQRLVYPARIPAGELYRRLRERNPAPFAGYFDLGDFVVASASPERFLRVQDGDVQTRPIKGTRHRGITPESDLFTRSALEQSEKDRAENIMIVDLLRNDLSRVCQPGTVHVPQLCQVEVFETVHHLVSEVRGRLRKGLGPIDLLRAAFPGGSITGAPKVRAMEIIAELEPTARGAYCGSLAYIGFDGSMDTSILIRTFTIGGGWVQFPVGGGIVAQSVPEQEYEETLDKADGMIRALV